MNVAFKEPRPATRSLDALAEALLLPSGIHGVYARTAAFEDVVDGLAALISRQREPGSGGELGCCAIIVAGAPKAGYDTALAEMYRLSDRCASL